MNKLASLGLAVAEETQVADLLVSFMHDDTMKGTIVAVKLWKRIKQHGIVFAYGRSNNISLRA